MEGQQLSNVLAANDVAFLEEQTSQDNSPMRRQFTSGRVEIVPWPYCVLSGKGCRVATLISAQLVDRRWGVMALEEVLVGPRMALVAHLTNPGETSPLLFDDVTVQTDSARTVAILDLLHEISHERQVIVLSQEEDVRRWAETSLNPERESLVRLELRVPAA